MLKYKLFKWFAGLVLVFGVLSAFLGIWVISQRIIQEAQTRVRYDLSSAWAVYQSQLEAIETVVKLVAVRSPLMEACDAQKWDAASRQEIQGILARACLDFNLDFLTVVSPEGQVVVRARSEHTGEYRNAEPLVATALEGGPSGSGTVLLSRQELAREVDGPKLTDQAFLNLQETPHARVNPRTTEDRGMVMLAAAPVRKNRVVGAIYAGILLNRNEAFVDRVQKIVFGEERYQKTAIGAVTVFLGDTRIATTIRHDNGNRAWGRASRRKWPTACWTTAAVGMIGRSWFTTGTSPPTTRFATLMAP